MKIKLFPFLLLLIICHISCRVEKRNLCDEFRKNKKLQHEKITIRNNEVYARIFQLLISGNDLIAYDYDGDFFFSITDIQDRTINGRFGKKGQGPNEIDMMPQALTIYNGKPTFYSFAQSALFSVDYIQDDDYILEKILAVDRNDRILFVLPVGAERYIALGGFQEGRYLLLDKDGNKLSFSFDYPSFEGDEVFTPMHKAMAFQGNLMSRPTGNSFFFAGRKSELLEIIEIREDGTLDKIFSYHGEIGKFVPEGDGVEMTAAAIKKESKMFFVDVNCTQNYIYLLCSNKVIGDNLDNAIKSNQVLVFDWNGNPVISYSLDIEVNYIAVDDMDKVLYAYDSGNEQLIKFAL